MLSVLASFPLFIHFSGFNALIASSPPLTSFADDTEFYATCGAGVERLLADELSALGLRHVQTAGAGVRFTGCLLDGYKACLWSRLANRVLLPIHQGPAASPEALYDLVQEVDWSTHLQIDGSLAVDFFTANSQITHSQYGALKVKDAVVDQFRARSGRRPDVERDTPDVRINVYLFRDKARVAIDLSGSSLHRRGYRTSGGLAPLKENLAAAILFACDWPARMRSGAAFYDPLCGSGTLLIEAAQIATNRAPGLLRNYFGFNGWKHHDEAGWQALVMEAQAGVCESPVPIGGADADPQAVDACRQNLHAAGLADTVELACQSVSSAPSAAFSSRSEGLLITNPPYGERLATDGQFYADLGRQISRHFGGWACGFFTASAAPYARARLPLSVLMKARNGGIDCVLLQGKVPAARSAAESVAASEDADNARIGAEDDQESEHPQAALYRGKQQRISPTAEAQHVQIDTSAFTNRLLKNRKALKGWLKQNQINAYRLYDSDLPEFALAIDIYHAQDTHCVVQEYQAPASVNISMAEARLKAAMQAIPAALGIEPANVHLKIRQIKSGTDQYSKIASKASVVTTVDEGGAKLELNLSDYLDTGLFLDHRPVRRYIQQNAKDKRFLNLFSYTATATVAAVCGGARSSVSVDSSRRYSEWAKRNLDNNKASAQLHEVVRQDVLSWLDAASTGLAEQDKFDLVLLDPPTFSNSTDLDDDWNVQRDHVAAIDACLAVMAPGGLLIFSNNYRRFKIEPILLEGNERAIRVEDRNRWSIDRDFQRNSRIHQCWFVYKQ